MKRHLTQDLLIAGLALALVLLAAVGIADLVSPESQTYAITEAFDVASLPISADGALYSSVFTGTVKNLTGDALTVDRISITVKTDGEVSIYAFNGFVLPARDEYELTQTAESNKALDRVVSVTLEANGKTETLTQSGSADFAGVLLILLVAVVLFFLVRAVKVRYYLYQEDRMLQESDR